MDTKEEILQFLADHKEDIFNKFFISKIGLFGSFATGKATQNSDIDIIFDFQEKVEDVYTTKMKLREYLSKELNRDVDLAREKYLKPYAKDNILKSVIYV